MAKQVKVSVTSEVDALDVDGVVFVKKPALPGCGQPYTCGDYFTLSDVSDAPDDPWWRLTGYGFEVTGCNPEKCVVLAREAGAALRAAFGPNE